MLVNSVGLLFFVLLVLDFGWIVCYVWFALARLLIAFSVLRCGFVSYCG